jgi:hypothetical protein
MSKRCALDATTARPVERAARYLVNNTKLLHYDRALADGLPIATGVIEGACRPPRHRPSAALADADPPGELDRRVIDHLARTGRPLSCSQLRAELHVRNKRLGDALSRLVAVGAILRTADRCAIPAPTPWG